MLPGYKRKEEGLYVEENCAIAGYRFTYPDKGSTLMALIREARAGELDLELSIVQALGSSEAKMVNRVMGFIDNSNYSPGDYVKIAHYDAVEIAAVSLRLATNFPLTRSLSAADWYVRAKVVDGRVADSIEGLNTQFKTLNTSIIEDLCRFNVEELPDYTHYVVESIKKGVIRRLDRPTQRRILEDIKALKEQKDQKPGKLLIFKKD